MRHIGEIIGPIKIITILLLAIVHERLGLGKFLNIRKPLQKLASQRTLWFRFGIIKACLWCDGVTLYYLWISILPSQMTCFLVLNAAVACTSTNDTAGYTQFI